MDDQLGNRASPHFTSALSGLEGCHGVGGASRRIDVEGEECVFGLPWWLVVVSGC